MKKESKKMEKMEHKMKGYAPFKKSMMVKTKAKAKKK
jgi:hypothetical protein